MEAGSKSQKIEPFSLSFKPNSKANNDKKVIHQNKRKPEQQEATDFIVSISGNELQSANGEPKRGPLVIPLPEEKSNRLISTKYLPLAIKKETPEAADLVKTPETKESTKHKEKSLDEQAVDELLSEAKGQKTVVEIGNDMELPLLLKFRNPALDEIEDEEKRFQKDVESRPNEATQEDYEKIPVEKFGTALLRGMGWAPGEPIGVTNPQVVVPIEYVQRPGYRTGLGATSAAPVKKKPKYLKPGESWEDFEEKVLQPKEDGTMRHIKTLDEKLVPISKTGMREGVQVSVVAGRHDGLMATITKMLANDEVIIKLESSQEEVKVDKADLHMIPGGKQTIQRSHTTGDYSSKEKPSEKPKKSGIKIWIYPNIVVRIISKSLYDGKYYLKKAKIDDIVGDTKCTVELLETNRLVDVDQSMLETVIPKVGGKVLVVEGSDRKKLGTLMEKGKDQAVVQLKGDFSVNTYNLDSISEYLGEDFD